MSKIKHITVTNKIAEYSRRDGYIVCDNSDYTILFTFDSEWDAHPEKTVRFIWNGKYKEVKMTGNECPVPIIHGAPWVHVGVYAGDLETTTAAHVPCKGSILEETDIAQPDQVEMWRDAAEEAAERAEEAADNAGEDAATAASAHLADILAQEPGTGKALVLSQDAVSTNFAGALKGRASGSTVSVNDVSPAEHTLKVEVHGKNRVHLLNASKTITNTDGLNLAGEVSNGRVTLSGTFNGGSPKAKVFRMDLSTPTVNYIDYEIIRASLAVKLHRGEYVFSANESASVSVSGLNGGYLLVGELEGTVNNGRAAKYRSGAKIHVDRDDYYAQFVVYIYQDNPVSNLSYTAQPQLELGDTATEYTPYVSPTTIKLTRYGADETDRAETFTPNEDGTVDGVTSITPTMTLLTDTEGATVFVEYNRDLNSALGDVAADVQELDRVTAELASSLGDIDTALDELHTYAETLKVGGVSV